MVYIFYNALLDFDLSKVEQLKPGEEYLLTYIRETEAECIIRIANAQRNNEEIRLEKKGEKEFIARCIPSNN